MADAHQPIREPMPPEAALSVAAVEDGDGVRILPKRQMSVPAVGLCVSMAWTSAASAC